MEFIIETMLKKLPALYAVFDIETDANSFKKSPSLLLILFLANRYIPGFCIVDSHLNKSGRPGQFTFTNSDGKKDVTTDGLRLFLLVQKYKREGSDSNESAVIREIIKNEQSFSDFKDKLGPRRLLNRYGEIKRAIAHGNTFANLLIGMTKKIRQNFKGTEEKNVNEEITLDLLHILPPRTPFKNT